MLCVLCTVPCACGTVRSEPGLPPSHAHIGKVLSGLAELQCYLGGVEGSMGLCHVVYAFFEGWGEALTFSFI